MAQSLTQRVAIGVVGRPPDTENIRIKGELGMDVYIAKIRKYLKLDPNVEVLNIHGEGFRLIDKS